MTRAPATCALLCLITSCQLELDDRPESDDRSRRTYAEDAVSFVTPDGWDVRRDRETLVLVNKIGETRGRSTIALRSVPVTGWGETRKPDNILLSTEKVLHALPGAEVSGPTAFQHPAYPAMAYDVGFTPRSRRGEEYRRRHIVLFSPGRVIHVLHTGPRDEIDRSQAAFDRLVESLREEG